MNIEKEIWKPIKIGEIDYTGYYEVSNMGRVRSLDRVQFTKQKVYRKDKGKVLKGGKTRGYPCVILNKKGSYKGGRINKLVATAFIREPKKGEHVHHKNGNKLDNRLSNLEIISHRENLSIERTLKSKLPVGVAATKHNTYLASISLKSYFSYTISLGTYKTINQASRAYQIALSRIEINEYCQISEVKEFINKYRESINMKPLLFKLKKRTSKRNR